MKHAGFSASDATFVEAEYDYDDGRMVYEVEFHVKGTEYDYEIDAQTGAVVKYKTEQNGANTGGSGSSGQSTGQSGSQTSGGTGTSSTDIGAEKAKSIALNHAGVSASQTYEMKVEQNWDDGVLEYEVEFKAGGVEYEYTIHGETGQILKYESDRD